MSEWIAVIAGTPVDTQMGIDILHKHGFLGHAYAMASDPLVQTAFQNQSAESKIVAVRKVLSDISVAGGKQVFVYCNSLAGAVDFDALTKESALKIITPHNVYRSLAKRYQRIGVIAANANGLCGIERVFYDVNPKIKIFGATLLPLVGAIERKEMPQKICENYGLLELIQWMQNRDVEALLLGCTHFPYFKESLAKQTSLVLLDPAEEMVRMLG